MSSKKLIIGNWKMNPATLDEAKSIARRIKKLAPTLSNVETVICPPAPFVIPVGIKRSIKHFHIGVQDISSHIEIGAHTGEVNGFMLKSSGVEFIIVGHSERRASGETDAVVAQKTIASLESGLIPVICIGENVRDEAGEYLEILKKQIKQSFAGVQVRSNTKIAIAYEPIWAIGAKEAMRPEDLHEMTIFVKKVFSDIFGADAGQKLKVLYGGSVNFRNAADIINIGKADGLLVGRESVNTRGFVELLKVVNNL